MVGIKLLFLYLKNMFFGLAFVFFSSPERWGYVGMFVCLCVVCRLSCVRQHLVYTFFVGSYLFNALTYQVHIWCEDTLGQ